MYDYGKEPLSILNGLANIIRDLLLKKEFHEYSSISSTSEENHIQLCEIAKKIDKRMIF